MSKIKIEEQIGGVVVYLKGEFIGGEETDELRDTLKKLAESPKNKIVIDMGKVTYLNSTALGVLISAHASVTKKGGLIVLCNLDKSIENLFVITKLSTVFPIYATLEDAIKNL
ncbi:anti-sigma factor antagonist [Bacteroidetes/Chlorobi group bacterium Naka2016]|jgi:anti-anti-sigma factor|nr:MAG: anti-sigma factor antagonist [Bacteroidetes/Chlorobi group bacterium Naka2016]